MSTRPEGPGLPTLRPGWGALLAFQAPKMWRGRREKMPERKQTNHRRSVQGVDTLRQIERLRLHHPDRSNITVYRILPPYAYVPIPSIQTEKATPPSTPALSSHSRWGSRTQASLARSARKITSRSMKHGSATMPSRKLTGPPLWVASPSRPKLRRTLAILAAITRARATSAHDRTVARRTKLRTVLLALLGRQ